jgi:hypothetical protein
MPAIPAIGAFVAANAATIVPAALTVAGTAYGASQQRKAASEALQAGQQATAQQMSAERQAYEQQRSDLEPWRQVGLGALQQLSQLYGIQVPRGTFETAQAPARPVGVYGRSDYLAANPDVAAEFAKPQVAAMFGNDPNAYAAYHYNTFGANEGRAPPGSAMAGQAQTPYETAQAPAPAPMEQSLTGIPGQEAMMGMETAGARSMALSPEGEVSGVSMAPRADQTLQMAPQPAQPQAMGQAPAMGQSMPGGMPANAPAGADPRFASFFASPDFQFRLQQGSQNVLAQRAAMGGLESGAAMRELQNVGQQEASAEYGNYFNRLSQLAGYGPAATAQSGAAAQNYAAAAGRSAADMGNLRAQTSYAQRYATGQAVGEGLGSIGNIFTQFADQQQPAKEMFNPAAAARGYGGATGQSFASFMPPTAPRKVDSRV